MSKSYERGLATRRKVLGDEWVDRALATATPFNADFQKMITSYCWDGIWNREGLPRRTRRMLVLAMTAALGRWEEFRLHVRAALESGDLDQDDLKEILLQAAIYCGVPAANTGFKEAREVIAELGASSGKSAKGRRAKRGKGKRR
ncbi:MAG TPA: carboxymuconolactone decarboxylase family protein [Usitatibacter sp.]|nr:carboxymuconolactone decarboxylase family protein [Usitatibacter sp.]